MDKYRTVIEELVAAGAVYNEETRVLSDVPYATESKKQTLDIYFPPSLPSSSEDAEGDSLVERESPAAEAAATATTTITTTLIPVHIHIHGGGWSRGGKATPFYGGPAVSQAAAKAGRIAVSIGYRLGVYPEFMKDCGAAIQWVQHHIERLGGDLRHCFLSGHSAGGHIASLLVLRHESFLEPYGIPPDFFHGLILLSGVYDLFNPLKKAPLDVKNKWFFLAYVLPAFGTDTQLRREASPLLLLDPEKETSLLGSVARTVAQYLPTVSLLTSLSSSSFRWSDALDAAAETAAGFNTDLVDGSSTAPAAVTKVEEEEEKDHETRTADDTAAVPPTPTPTVHINTQHLPPVLVLNAYVDMGLQENGALFAKALSEYTSCRHAIVPGTDHASICWNETSMETVNEFIQSCCRRRVPKNSDNENVH
jgi:acetyl esterase/lipase